VLRSGGFVKHADDIFELRRLALSADDADKEKFKKEITTNKWYWLGMGTIADITPEEHPELWTFVQNVAAQAAVARVMERERLQLNMGKIT